jgi:hypothetical protein
MTPNAPSLPTPLQCCTQTSQLLRHYFESGTASAKWLKEHELPLAVETLRERAKELLHGKPFSVVMDGGTSKLMNGAKVIIALASAPHLPFDIVLDILFLYGEHETGEIQADFIDKMVKEFGLKRSQIKHFAADNVSLNQTTVTLINGRWGAEGALHFARCLPHTLALVMIAFFSELEDAYSLGHMLKMFRAYIVAGGGNKKRSILLANAIALSNVDLSDTRWGSKIKTICYVGGVHDDREIKAALEHLQLLSGRLGDGSDIKVGARRLDSMYTALESTEVEAGKEVPECRKDVILAWLANVNTLVAVNLVVCLFAGVPSLFKLLQYDATNDAMAADFDKDAPTASASVTELIAALDALRADKPSRKTLLDEVQANVEEHQAELLPKMIDQQRAANLAAGQEFDAGACAAALQAAGKANLAAAMKKVATVLNKCLAAYAQCEGRKKLEEVLKSVRAKDMFGLRRQPRVLPAGDAELFELFEIPDKARSFALIQALRLGWAEHRAQWQRKDWHNSKPNDAYEYWLRRHEAHPALSGWAIYHLLRPISSAAAERVFSILTNMDETTRRTMKAATLYQTLFLRANNRLLEEVQALFAAVVREGPAEHKRKAPRPFGVASRPLVDEEVAVESSSERATRLASSLAARAVASLKARQEASEACAAAASAAAAAAASAADADE